eukprot:Pgem_evm1s839
MPIYTYNVEDNESSICQSCHVHAECISNKCVCKGDLVGDGINHCLCEQGYKRKYQQYNIYECVPVSFYDFIVDKTIFKLSSKVSFPKDSNPYQILQGYPFHNRVEEDDKHNVKHLSINFDTIINKAVLNLVMHKADGDGNKRLPDRQRTEFKASATSSSLVKGYEDDTVAYMWWFKINKDVKPSRHFFHIFQLKVNGNVPGTPLFTFSIEKKGRRDCFVFHHFGVEYELGKLKDFAGKWIQAFVQVKYAKKNGYIKFDLKDIYGKRLIKQPQALYNANHWIEGTDFVRPKWGIYRSLKSPEYLNNEDNISFTDFTIYKKQE